MWPLKSSGEGSDSRGWEIIEVRIIEVLLYVAFCEKFNCIKLLQTNAAI